MLVRRGFKEKLQSALCEIGVPSKDYPTNLHNAYGLISAAIMDIEDGSVDCKRHSFKDLADRARMARGIRIANILLYNSNGDDEFFQAAQIILESSAPEK